jgi:hypothetical protein
MCVINVDLSQLSATQNNAIIGGKHRHWSSLFTPGVLSVTFRDLREFKLREHFIKIWYKQQTAYFDEIKSDIKILDPYGKVLFESKSCVIDTVSQVQLDNNNAQISEFTVSFIMNDFSTAETKDIGKGIWV